MDCNKDEAFRAKEIAERKVTQKDYSGAKKFALKAQSLFPGLDGVAQMLTTIDVYISSENKVNGEIDWYGILGVNAFADDETVKKQYRKLALALHPDKNKAVGADGAFKLVSEAWSLLSDKARRSAYNQKINVRGTQRKFPTHSGVPHRPNGSQTSSNHVAGNARTHYSGSRAAQTPVTSSKKPATFWTVCNRCKTQYEYLRVYLNHTLLCPNCHEAFFASEKAPPPSVSRSSNWSSHDQQQTSGPNNSNQVNYNKSSGGGGLAGSSKETNFQSGAFSGMSAVNSTMGSSSAASEAVTGVQQAQEKLKREHGEPSAEWDKSQVSEMMGDRPFKRQKDEIHVNGYVGGFASQMASGNGPSMGSSAESKRGFFQTESIYRFSNTYSKPNIERELSMLESRNMLVYKARLEIRKKFQGWSSLDEAKNVIKDKMKVKEKASKKQKSTANGIAHDIGKDGASFAADREFQGKNSSPVSAPDGLFSEAREPISINVPDPDFHNFDLDRTETSFGEDQVWAAYDDDDGMPRFYARVHKVISFKPFKMKISWLNSRSTSEFGQLDWVGSGFFKTCGEFRTGRHEISDTLNSFSHKVQWSKGMRGLIRILPRKGDVWALYRNWSPDWNEHTPDEVIHKYDMVEVLEDYNEEEGVPVVPLVKVTGFRTVFQKHMDPKEVKRILKEEMFRFSHQVPNYLLTGTEAPNAPKDCRELDPAATPLELLQVINEAGEATVVANSQRTKEEILNSADTKKAKKDESYLEAKEGQMLHNNSRVEVQVDN